MNKKAFNTHAAAPIQPTVSQIPIAGYMREWQVVGSKKKNIQGVLPISRSSFLEGIRTKRYNITPVKLGPRTTAYKAEEIRALIIELGGSV